MAKINGENVVSYVHNAAAGGMGKLDVLIAFEADGRLWLGSHHGEPRDVTELLTF